MMMMAEWWFFNDLVNDEEHVHNTMFAKTREFHKISIVLLKLDVHSHHHHLSLLLNIYDITSHIGYHICYFYSKTIMMMAMIDMEVPISL